MMPEYFSREHLAVPVMQLSNTNGEELKTLITKRKKNIKLDNQSKQNLSVTLVQEDHHKEVG